MVATDGFVSANLPLMYLCSTLAMSVWYGMPSSSALARMSRRSIHDRRMFTRVPDMLGTEINGHLTPIPMSEELSSLSAILLDSDYYGWARAGRTAIEGLPVVRPEHMIPLKAKAWLDLAARAADGQRIDRKDIRKHRNDVFRLYAIVDPEYRPQPAASLRSDMTLFIERMRTEDVDLKAAGLGGASLETVLDALSRLYAFPTT